jgi:NADH:ubiquinone oxidoreductase subunit F (NADH-binding)
MTCQATPLAPAGSADMATTAAHRRVLGDVGRRETYAEYAARGGYRADADAALVTSAAEAAGLAGRGGAGFPLFRKLAAVAASVDEHRVAVANGEEGEPGSVKDRLLLRTRPHLVLDGLRLAALAVGAPELHVYLSDPVAAESVRAAIAEAGATLPAIRVAMVAPSYVAGEESAVVRFLDGGPALPTAKPPRAYEAGVGGHPTVVSNVETLAQLALAVSHGVGADDTASILVTISGDGLAPMLAEVSPTATLRSLIGDAEVAGVLCGGLFGGLRRSDVIDVPLDHAAMRAAGTSLGCGAFYVMGPGGCAVELITDAVAYLSRESSHQCGVCLKGTGGMAESLRRLSRGEATADDVEPLRRWSSSLRGRGNCALLDAACELVGSLLAHWGDVVDAHLAARGCVACARRIDDFSATKLAVDPAAVGMAAVPAAVRMAAAPATLASNHTSEDPA